MGWFDFLKRQPRVEEGVSSGQADAPDTNPGSAGQSANAMKVLSFLGIFSLVVLAIWASSQEHGIRAFTWSLIAALAVLVTGGALGLLFGLPTAQTAHIGGGQGKEEDDLGYRESTSLEQVADWLTKILIGLTLTQFTTWEVRFSTLSSNLTQILIGSPSPIPGGMLLTFYGVLGFLIAYLWMRRYFIHELVAANAEARARRQRAIKVISAGTQHEIEGEMRRIAELDAARAEAEKQKIEAERILAAAAIQQAEDAMKRAELEEKLRAAEARGLAQKSTDQLTETPDSEAVTILREGQRLLPGESKGIKALAAIEKAILEKPTDPQDPWRGKFGEQSSAGGLMLEATVKTTSNSNTFRIDLVVRTSEMPPAEAAVGIKVLYYLHPTFGPAPRASTLGADGRAPLELYAYGAFTVGVVTENGTMLELNLATLADVPDTFRTR